MSDNFPRFADLRKVFDMAREEFGVPVNPNVPNEEQQSWDDCLDSIIGNASKMLEKLREQSTIISETTKSLEARLSTMQWEKDHGSLSPDEENHYESIQGTLALLKFE